MDNQYLKEEILAKQAEAKALGEEVAKLDEDMLGTKTNRDKLELEVKDLREKHEALAKRFEFLSKNYDFTISVKNLNRNKEDFLQLQNSNLKVNEQVQNFLGMVESMRNEDMKGEFE